MKNLLFFLIFAASMAFAADEPPVVKGEADLAGNTDKRIILEGIYRHPGKGDRSIDCGFVSVDIQDYSFHQKAESGNLISDISDGDRIRFEAELKYDKGGKFRVSKAPRGIQWAPPPIKVIKGKEYYVRPPSYSICNAKLIKIVKPGE